MSDIAYRRTRNLMALAKYLDNLDPLRLCHLHYAKVIPGYETFPVGPNTNVYWADNNTHCVAGHAPKAGIVFKVDEYVDEYEHFRWTKFIDNFLLEYDVANRFELHTFLFGDVWEQVDPLPNAAAARIRFFLQGEKAIEKIRDVQGGLAYLQYKPEQLCYSHLIKEYADAV